MSTGCCSLASAPRGLGVLGENQLCAVAPELILMFFGEAAHVRSAVACSIFGFPAAALVSTASCFQ